MLNSLRLINKYIFCEGTRNWLWTSRAVFRVKYMCWRKYGVIICSYCFSYTFLRRHNSSDPVCTCRNIYLHVLVIKKGFFGLRSILNYLFALGLVTVNAAIKHSVGLLTHFMRGFSQVHLLSTSRARLYIVRLLLQIYLIAGLLFTSVSDSLTELLSITNASFEH